MKKILSLFALMGVMTLQAQFDDNSPQTFPFLEGLKKAIHEELMKLGNNFIMEDDFPTYLEDGKKIDSNDPMLKDQKTFQNFMTTLYIDKDGVPKAMVLIKMTDEQKKMVEQFSDLSMEEMDKAGMEMIGKPAPPFSVKTLSGDDYTDQSLLGKTVVINFWFIKCKPCIDEIPKLNKLVRKYNHNKDVVFLSISFDQKKDIRSFLDKNTFEYQHVGKEGKGSSLIGKYKVMVFPTHMIIDPTGKVVLRNLGEGAIRKIDKHLKKL